MSDRRDRGGGDRGPGSARLRERELEVARDIADAFLTASTPLEVYRRALARVTPQLGASFASVFLRDRDDPRLLRLVCAHNWPQSAARWLGEIRIMVGRGPTGKAVGRNHAVEVSDVFADPSLAEWWEPARELGFASMVALPLAVESRAFGALSFYFTGERRFAPEDRELLEVVAHQLAATAERARLMADLESRSLALERENEALRLRLTDTEATLEQVRRPDRERGGENGGLSGGRSGPAGGSR
ncbi:MAG TPA: GAF domain-containing protein [Longimicrobiales bacterium]|nr:GAF domain-containing protein [Longimicrobiales bacterium]